MDAKDAKDTSASAALPGSLGNLRQPNTMDDDPIGEPSKPPLSTDATNAEDDILTAIFRFLATATPGTLGGIAVGLAATTYLIVGQVGLLLIGAFGGIVLFVQWEQRDPEVARAVRGESGIETVARLLDIRATDEASRGLRGGARSPWQGMDDGQKRALLARRFDDFPRETRAALNDFVDAIVRDYVKWWYSPLVSTNEFPMACQDTLTTFIITISSHLTKKRPADLFLNFLTHSSSIFIVFLSEFANAFAELPPDSGLSSVYAIHNYLASHPDSSLSSLLSRRQQVEKLKRVADDLLQFLDRPAFECYPVRAFLREILAKVILEMSLDMCSKPEWINSWIVYLLEAGEPDLNQAIDVGMQTNPDAVSAFADMDGNVGNIGLAKASRNSVDLDKPPRRPSSGHAPKSNPSTANEQKSLHKAGAGSISKVVVEEEGHEMPGPRDRSSKFAPGNSALGGEVLDLSRRSTEDAHNARRGSDEEWAGHENESGRQSGDLLGSGDGVSSFEEGLHTPATPRSGSDASCQGLSSDHKSPSRFTDFEQLVPPAEDGSEAGEEPPRPATPPPLTLHNATITVLDDLGDKGRIRNKPSWDYLIQIEPTASMYPGWMIVRKYPDFERLHEVLRRIAQVSGATAFTEQHSALPAWKVHTRTSLRGELERYIRDACWYQSLAESEGMKRFLERDNQGHHPVGNSKPTGFQAFEKIGKNVFDVLTTAPVEGSKAVVGGVTGVLGNIGIGKKVGGPAVPPSVSSAPAPKNGTGALQDVTAASRLSMSTPPRLDRLDNQMLIHGARKRRDSLDSQRSSVVSTQPGKVAPMERRSSCNSQHADGDVGSVRMSRSEVWERRTASGGHSREASRSSNGAPLQSPPTWSLSDLNLPPPPAAMPDDYESPVSRKQTRRPIQPAVNGSQSVPINETAVGEGQSFKTPTSQPQKIWPGKKQHSGVTEHETRMAVELIFAIINEMYTLSSAWNIRRTLLAAAKSFLLRPGNPSLTSIQSLIQESVLEANLSDAGVAAHLRQLRANAMPTEEERAAWPAEMNMDEKERLRARARRLLIASGVPAALTGVMGQSATADALGRLFDCLQLEQVARGLMCGLMVQAARIITD